MKRFILACATAATMAGAVLGATMYINGQPVAWGPNGEFTFEPQQNLMSDRVTQWFPFTNNIVRWYVFPSAPIGSTEDWSLYEDDADTHAGTPWEPLFVASNDLGLAANALYFGTDSQTCTFTTNSMGTSAGTMAAWIKLDSISRIEHIMGIYSSTNASRGNTFFSMYHSLGRPGVYRKHDGANSAAMRITSAIKTNDWTHVTVTGNGTNFLIYINGTNTAFGSGGGTDNGLWTGPCMDATEKPIVGRLSGPSGGGEYNLRGNLMRPVWLGVALNGDEVLTLYTNELARKNGS